MIHRNCIPILCVIALAGSASAQATGQRLDTIRVTSRASVAASATRAVQVITREELDHRAGRSLAELLSFAVGTDVQTRSPAQSDLSLRGSTFNQVVVLVDGIRVSDVQSGHYALDLAVPTAMIDRIEILRGAGSALYGSDAIGGIVNIITRNDASGSLLAARGGSFGGAALSAAQFGRVGSVVVRASGDVDRSDGHRPGTDYRIAQARLSLEKPTSAGRFIADLGDGVRHFGAADFYSPFPSDETTRASTAAVRFVPRGDANVSFGGSLHTRRHYDLFTLKRDDPAYYQNEHVSNESGGELVSRGVLAPIIVAALGGDLLDARLRSARLGNHTQTRAGAFGQLTVGTSGLSTLDLGLRSDWLSDQRSFVSPSVGVALPLGNAAQLHGSVSRGFRAPTWTERYYVDPANVADSTLAVERFWSHEVGARATLFGTTTGDVTLYERRATDLIDWAKPADSMSTSPWRTRNFASATYRGIEAVLHLPEMLGVDWTAHGSGLQFDASTAAGLVGKYALRPITRSVGLSGVTQMPMSGTFAMDALRARRTNEQDHTTVNARLTLPVRDARVSLELINLTGADYLDGAGKPVAGRSVFAGVAWGAR